MQIVKSILSENPCYLKGVTIKVRGLMLHSVGCSQPSAEVFLRKWNNRTTKVCVHAFVDGNTGIVYQTLPWGYRAWHCGGEGNNGYIGVEMCEPSCIQYVAGSKFQCSNLEVAREVVKRTYDVSVQLFSELCVTYELNPLSKGTIVSHNEGHKLGIASGHSDPEHLWAGLKTDYTMDEFRRAVMERMSQKKQMQLLDDSEKETENIVQGDSVKIITGATYYDGKVIPNWVLADKWIVKNIQGNRAVIDKNVSGTSSICSPIDRKYLIKNE